MAILGQTGPGISYYNADVTTVVNSAAGSKAHVIVNGVGDPATAPNLAANLVMTADGPNQALRTHNLQCKAAAVREPTEKAAKLM